MAGALLALLGLSFVLLAGCLSVPVPTPAPAATRAAVVTPLVSPTETAGAAPQPMPPAGSPPPRTGLVEAQVLRVVDGDTIEVRIGRQAHTVRYIGIDTPETVKPDTPVQPFGPEATAKNHQLVDGKVVRLEKDVSETDRYGRLLRYVYVGDLMVNAELVRTGLAYAATFPPDVKHQDLFLRLEREARAAGRGLWGDQQAQGTSGPAGAAGGYTCGRCIKGNINAAGEKVYHFPGCRDYERVVIDEGAGERWFSSEQEARAAGWYKAGNCP